MSPFLSPIRRLAVHIVGDLAATSALDDELAGPALGENLALLVRTIERAIRDDLASLTDSERRELCDTIQGQVDSSSQD